MAWEKVFTENDVPAGIKKTTKLGEQEILVVHTAEGQWHAMEAKCPHAGAPLEKGAVCDGRIVCPWHMGAFALENGALLEPPPLRSLKSFAIRVEQGAVLVDPAPRNQPSLAAYDEHKPAPAIGHDQHIITIGGGAASAAAVCTLRQNGFAGRISVLDPVESEPLDRTNLSKMTLAGKTPKDALPLWKPEEQAKLKVERIAKKVKALDSQARSVTLADGATIHYDKALLATGGVPRGLGIPGDDLPFVRFIRHVADLDAIDEILGENPLNKKAVLLGDSFIAFEAASALTTRGLRVTLVCRSPQPFAKKFGAEPAEAILALHKKNNVALHLGAEASEIGRDGVVLKSGETLPADLVIVAVGVRPATDFQHELPLAKDGGVAVSASLKAGETLWIAGDIASVDGTRSEHWRLAEQHGRTAAFGMLHHAGDDATHAAENFHGVPFFWTAHFGKRFGYVGHADQWDSIEVDGSLDEPKFLAFYLKGGSVKAVLGCNRDAALAMLSVKMQSPLTLSEAKEAAKQAE